MHSKLLRKCAPVLLLCISLCVSCSHERKKAEIFVSAAISLKNAFEEIGVVYEKETGVSVKLNLGASGILQKQIEAGAPVDVFASAGTKQMDALQEAGLIVDSTRRNFVQNQLVLVVPSGSTLRLDSFDDLMSPEISRLAIGNPNTVPAGQYAEQALKSLNLWEAVQPRLVPSGNVRQVLDYVVREEVDAGIVYASDVPVTHGKVVIAAAAPENSHSPILYPIAVVRDAVSPSEARPFIDFVLDASGQAILGKYGFLTSR